jgi:hypothetical protein
MLVDCFYIFVPYHQWHSNIDVKRNCILKKLTSLSLILSIVNIQYDLMTQNVGRTNRSSLEKVSDELS